MVAFISCQHLKPVLQYSMFDGSRQGVLWLAFVGGKKSRHRHVFTASLQAECSCKYSLWIIYIYMYLTKDQAVINNLSHYEKCINFCQRNMILYSKGTKLFCRCSCTQSFKSTPQKSNLTAYQYLYLTNINALIILKLFMGQTKLSILLQEGSCSACRLVICQVCGSLVNKYSQQIHVDIMRLSYSKVFSGPN